MRNLVLWGHNLADYREMFDLSDADLDCTIIEYGSGPTGFNVQMHQRGRRVISCDDMFGQPQAQVHHYFDHAFRQMLTEVNLYQHHFNWTKYGDLNGLVQKRRQGMQDFFVDYAAGQMEGRYVGCNILQLPFKDFQFKIALSSHYLFANIDNPDEVFHLGAINELVRVAHEVRIFPLIDRTGKISNLLGPVMLAMQQQNLGVEVRAVPYSLQPQGNAMLRVWAQQCKVV